MEPSTNAALQMSNLATSLVIPNVISSQESPAGALPSDSQRSLTLSVGLAPALAPASPAQGRAQVLQTLVEGSGRNFTASSKSVSLNEFLGNRLRALSATGGSMLYRLTWKARD